MAVPTASPPPSPPPAAVTAAAAPTEAPSRGARVRWTVGAVLVVGLMVLPVVMDRDSFPLSTYPMYSRARSTEVTIPTAIGIDGTGAEHRLTLQVIGASDDPLIVAGELRTAIAQDRATDRCPAIAERASTSLAELDLVSVLVVVERHDVVGQVMGEPSLLDRTVHAECALGAPS